MRALELTPTDQIPAKPMPTEQGDNSKTFGDSINKFFEDLCNYASLFSMFVLVVSAAFIGLGHYLDYRVQNQAVPFMFFLAPMAIMVIYAAIYCNYANSKEDDFDGGLISARLVKRWIYYMCSVSLAIAAYQMLRGDWSDADYTVTLLCLWANPAAMIVFALVYGLYASCTPVDVADSGRRASAHRTMALTTVLTMVIFLYNICLAAMSLNFVTIFFSLASFAGAFTICFGVMFVFQRCVDAKTDRGVRLH